MGNAVIGAAALLTADAVQVANAELKKDHSWREQDKGICSATYKARTAGERLRASLKLSGWGQVLSEAYAIKAATPVQENSRIVLGCTAWDMEITGGNWWPQLPVVTKKPVCAVGTDMTVTVTLKDVMGNAVSGAAASLTTDAVQVANADPAGSGWREQDKGTYSATYKARTPGERLKATLRHSGWSRESAVYAIREASLVQKN